MPKLSSGLIIFRRVRNSLEVFLVHPGGPFWVNKDLGAWSIPKGEHLPNEDSLAAARREFEEETSVTVPPGKPLALTSVKQISGKVIQAWAIEGDFDASLVRSNLFSMEWPPGSGKLRQFPEIDRGEWFPLNLARQKISQGQVSLLDELASMINEKSTWS